MRLLLSLFMFLATVMTPTVQGLPGSSVVCDLNRVSKHRVAGTSAARFQLSAASVAPGGSTSITLAGNHGGFLLYVTDAAGTHVGTFGGALATASRSCTSGVPAGTTVSHTAATLQTSRTFMWTAPTTPGTYTVTAIVAESAAGTPTLLNVPSATITVAAAQAQPTQAPTQPATRPPTQPPTQPPSQTQTQAPAQTAKPATTTAPRPVTPTTSAPVVIITPPGTDVTTPSTTPVDVTPSPSKPPATGTGRTPATASPDTKDAYNLVLVTLQDVLAGTATVAQLRTAIQNLMTQIQAAIQKAKAAQGAANANAKVKMIVTKAPATAAANSLNLAIGFADAADAVVFAALVKDATDPAARAQSPLTTSGDLAAQVQPNPTGYDTNTGEVTVTDAQQVTTVTCSDGTVVSQDMQAVLCPNAAFSPAAGAGAGTNNAQAVPLSNGAFIGIIVTGIVLIMALVAGLMYYQKAKAKSTSVAPRV